MIRKLIQTALAALLLVGAAAPIQAATKSEKFVERLYRRYAYRSATPAERSYWKGVVESWKPEKAEQRLRNWFFVHAAYKTTLGRTVTFFEVKRTVDMLDAGKLDFRAVQYSLFHSPEYQQAKRNGKAGTMMVTLPSDPS